MNAPNLRSNSCGPSPSSYALPRSFGNFGVMKLPPIRSNSCGPLLIPPGPPPLELSKRTSFGSFETFKLPIPVQCEIAAKAGTIETLEGSVSHQAGDAIMTGPMGERWPIPSVKFSRTYDQTASGFAIKKHIVLWAEQMSAPFKVTLNWDEQGTPLNGKPHDYLVQYGAGDFSAVNEDVFKFTYDRSNRPPTPPLEEGSQKSSTLNSRWVSC